MIKISRSYKKTFCSIIPHTYIEQDIQDILFPTVEITNYDIMIDCRKMFGKLVKNNIIKYENIRKFAVILRDDHFSVRLTIFKKNL